MGAPVHTSRVGRVLRLITEVKVNPALAPAQLVKTLGVSRARYFQDKRLAEASLGFRFRFNRAKKAHEILADPYVPVPSLRLTELFALILSVRQLSAAGDYVLTYEAIEGIKKLAANAGAELRPFLQAVLDDVVLQEGFGVRASTLEDLRRASAEHQHVLIRYRHYEDGAVRDHEIDPYQLFFRRRALYLDTYDKRARDFRTFRVNRIEAVKFLGISGPMQDGYNFAARFRDSFSAFTGPEATSVKVRFSARAAPYIKEGLWHWSQQITPLKNGDILYQVRVSYPKEVAWWAMGWGGDAEVLEPADLRAYLTEESRRMAHLYAARPALKERRA